MNRLLAAPFPGNGQWLQAVTRLHSILITVGHDGQNFEAYARELEGFELLKPALDHAARIVSSSQWFQQNIERLKWEEELYLCLIAEDGRI